MRSFNNMKATLRIPTKEQFAYIEVEVEGSKEGIINQYKEFTQGVHGGFGLDRLEFNKILDTYMTTGKILSEEYEQMSSSQQNIIQEIKKSFARVNK